MRRMDDMAMLLKIKRNTWCRLFHRWHKSMVVRGGMVRTTCSACSDADD